MRPDPEAMEKALMNRRSLLKALGVGVAAPKVSLAQAAQMIGVSGPLASTGEIGDAAAGMATAPWSEQSAMMFRIASNNRYRGSDQRSLPVHIATKRSWSPAFKDHEARREALIWEVLEEKIRRDEGFAARLFGIATGKSDGGLG